MMGAGAGAEELLHGCVLPKLLATFEGDLGAALDASTDAAIRAISLAVALPHVFRMDALLDFAAVRNLRTATASQAVSASELLDVFVRGTLADYRAWRAKHGETSMAALGLRDADCEAKIRLLTLLSVCAKKSDGGAPVVVVVPFAEIAAQLDVPEEDTEKWVVQAIAAKLLSGKIDQVARVVRIGSYQQRVFEAAQWKQLDARLSAWRSSVIALHSVLQQVQK
jgi:translation initiation factor 3 subunit M